MSTALINGINVEYQVEGTGTPLVWVMGTGMSGAAWRRYQTPHFKDRYTCVTYDMRGVGATDCPTDRPYTPALLAEDLLGLLDHLEIERAHLAGFSLGAATAQEMAIRNPERVSSISLISTWSRTDDEHHMRRHYQSRLRALEEADIEVFRAFAFWMWSPRLVDEEHDRILELEKFLGSATGSRDVSGFAGHFRADLAHDTRDRLPGITCPALVVYGEDDLITLPWYNAEVAKRIPGAALVEVPRAGHLMFLEQPEAMNQAIDGFLARIAAGGE
jgi:pimeloyl-ACP methyl ester carboxylesterase